MVQKQKKTGISLPLQLRKQIDSMTQQDFHELIAKDIHWSITRDLVAGQPRRTLSKQIQLQKVYLKVYYGQSNHIEALFPNNVSVRFGPKYFEDYSAMKFASLVYLLIDRFGPIRNPMAFNIQRVRQQLGMYKQFQSKNVLRFSLRNDPVYQTILCMTRNFSD